MKKPNGDMAGAVVILTVLAIVGVVFALVTGFLSGTPALAMQALSDKEMAVVTGRNSLHIGLGAGYPVAGSANGLLLAPDESSYVIEIADRPNDSSSPIRDRYEDDFAIALCEFDDSVNHTTSPLPPGKILVPVDISLEMLSGSTNDKPMLSVELYCEYDSWPGNQPDLYMDMLGFHKDPDLPWYEDPTWTNGVEMHIDGITFLSYPYHDVDDIGTTPDGLNQTYTAEDIANRTPAFHVIFGADNDEQGLVGELGGKLFLPGVSLNSVTGTSTNRRTATLIGVLLAGNIAQNSFADEFYYDEKLSNMDFDGEFNIGKADSTNDPNHDFVDNHFTRQDNAPYFPLTISPAVTNQGYGTTYAFIVIEGCGTRQGTTKFEVANLSYTDTTAGAHPYYDKNSDRQIDDGLREYLMGDLRIGMVTSKLDRTPWNGTDNVEDFNMGEQAVVVNDINVPYFKLVFAVDGQIGDILQDAWAKPDGSGGYSPEYLELTRNDCYESHANNIRFGVQYNVDPGGGNKFNLTNTRENLAALAVTYDKVTDPPEYIRWGGSTQPDPKYSLGTPWYTPASAYNADLGRDSYWK